MMVMVVVVTVRMVHRLILIRFFIHIYIVPFLKKFLHLHTLKLSIAVCKIKLEK